MEHATDFDVSRLPEISDAALIDTSLLEEMDREDTEGLRELTGLYFTHAGTYWAGLLNASETNDAAMAMEISHKWAGAAATSGLPRLADYLRDLEACFRQGGLANPRWRESLDLLRQSSEQGLREFFETRG